MKNNRKVLVVMLIMILVILAACGDSSDESSTAPGNQSQDNDTTQGGNDASSNSDSTEDASNTDSTNIDTNDLEDKDTNEKADTSNNIPTKEEDSPANNTASLKEEYLKKLNNTKQDMEEMQKNPIDDSTFALKKVEGDRFDVWDELLNEAYEVLEKQLPLDEMEQLRKEQREWIDYRDHTAKEASLKYEGGTMEQLEYVTVENNLTEERCFELVESYMK